MTLRPARLSVADWLAAGGSVALLVVLFALPWYQVKPQFRDSLLELGARVSANGWQTFTWVGPLCLLVGVLGLLYVFFQATRRAPALPMVTATVMMPLSLLLVLSLLVRVFIAIPVLKLADGGNAVEATTGAYAGFALSVLVAGAMWRSFRREGVYPGDAIVVIERLPLEPPHPGDPT